MIRIKVSGYGMESIVNLVEIMSHPDMMPLARIISEIMEEDNRAGLMAGLDWNSDRNADPMPSTIRRGRGGDGPPLVPRGEASRAISDYSVEIQEEADRILLVGGWRNTPFIHFHATGTKYMVARDPTGVREAGQTRIAEALAEYALSLVGGRVP